MQFLMGLNESCIDVHIHILMVEPLPPISKVFDMVI